jgi:hypothetical protein
LVYFNFGEFVIPGTIIKVWKPDWGCFHLGIVGERDEVLHYVSDVPGKTVETKLESGEWILTTQNDVDFISDCLRGIAVVETRDPVKQ